MMKASRMLPPSQQTEARPPIVLFNEQNHQTTPNRVKAHTSGRVLIPF